MDRGGQDSLLDFARFLAQREPQSEQAPENEAVTEPLGLARPEQETVVAAIRRLSENYPMLNKNELLHQAASLMTAHVLHGRKAPDVIDELEQLFMDAYRAHTGTEEEG